MRRHLERAWLVFRRAVDALVRIAGTRDAAQVAFFVLISFPATLLLLVWGVSSTLDHPGGLRQDIVEAVVDAIPLSTDEGRREVERLLDDVAKGAGGLGIAVVLALLYSASGAIGGLRHAIHEALETRDDRPWAQGKLLDIGLVLVVAPVAVGGLALKLSNVVPSALDDEPFARGVSAFLLTELAPMVIAFVLLVGLFRVLPVTEMRLRDAWPGALVAVLGLRLAQAIGEGLVSLFGSTGAVYGAIAGLLAAGYGVYLGCVVIVVGMHVSAQLARLPTAAAIDAALAAEEPGDPFWLQVLHAIRGIFLRR